MKLENKNLVIGYIFITNELLVICIFLPSFNNI